jgi:hypothetical protein
MKEKDLKNRDLSYSHTPDTWVWFSLGCGDILIAAIHHMMYCRPPGPLVSPHFGDFNLLPFSRSTNKT